MNQQTTLKKLEQLAKLLVKENALRAKVRAVREEQKAFAGIYKSVGLNGQDGTWNRITIEMELGAFVSLYSAVSPTISTWEATESHGEQIAMHYGPVPSGLVVGDIELWVEAYTPWTDVKPKAETMTAQAA